MAWNRSVVLSYYLKLMRQWTALFLKLFGDNPVYLAIDDSIVLRHSKKAPMSQIHHQHGNKTNLSRYVRGQCRVALAAIVKRSGCNTALPLLLRLTPQAGNSGKLVIARSLIRALMEPLKDKAVTVLVDSWYMRRSFIEQRWLKPAFWMASRYALSGVSLRTLKGKKDHVYYCQQVCS